MRITGYISILILAIAFSCTKSIDLDLPLRNPRLVVEGIITNEDTSYTVKLSNTTKYKYSYDKAAINYETGATVVISDNIGNYDTLKENPAGIYTSNPSHLKGTIGRNYYLDILTKDGRHYQSKPETMLNVPKIDSIYFTRNRNDHSPTYPSAYRYTVYIKLQDPKNLDNYYMQITSYYWNNTWQAKSQWNTIFNDFSIDGRLINKIADQGYSNGTFFVKVNLYALNKSNYDFWNTLYQQRYSNQDGEVDLLVPLVGNIFNVNDPNDYAIGYFQVSATSSSMVYVK
jgi:hypothetical protein